MSIKWYPYTIQILRIGQPWLTPTTLAITFHHNNGCPGPTPRIKTFRNHWSIERPRRRHQRVTDLVELKNVLHHVLAKINMNSMQINILVLNMI